MTVTPLGVYLVTRAQVTVCAKMEWPEIPAANVMLHILTSHSLDACLVNVAQEVETVVVTMRDNVIVL